MEKFEIIKKADPIGTFDIKLPDSIKSLDDLKNYTPSISYIDFSDYKADLEDFEITEVKISKSNVNVSYKEKDNEIFATLNNATIDILFDDKEMEDTFKALRNSSLKNDGKFTIDSVMDITPVKPKSVPEMVLELMANKNVNLNDTFKNMDEQGVNDASDKLKETLNSDKFKNSEETANFLSTALDGVKEKLLNVTNKDMSNVECFDQIQNIGQEMSAEMIKNMEEDILCS